MHVLLARPQHHAGEGGRVDCIGELAHLRHSGTQAIEWCTNIANIGTPLQRCAALDRPNPSCSSCAASLSTAEQCLPCTSKCAPQSPLHRAPCTAPHPCRAGPAWGQQVERVHTSVGASGAALLATLALQTIRSQATARVVAARHIAPTSCQCRQSALGRSCKTPPPAQTAGRAAWRPTVACGQTCDKAAGKWLVELHPAMCAGLRCTIMACTISLAGLQGGHIVSPSQLQRSTPQRCPHLLPTSLTQPRFGSPALCQLHPCPAQRAPTHCRSLPATLRRRWAAVNRHPSGCFGKRCAQQHPY